MKICIVGGGLAGLAYAVSAANAIQTNDDNDDDKKEDLEIFLLEKNDFSNRGATFGLARSGQAAMEEFAPELLQELKDIGIIIPQTGAYMLPWYRVRDGLLCRAEKEPCIQVFKNTTVTSIDEVEHENQPCVAICLTRVDDMTASGGDETAETHTDSQTLLCDYVVGADGVNSFVRKVLGAPPAVSSNTLCWRGAINDIPDDLTHLVEGPIARTMYHKTGIFAIFNFHKSMKNFLSWVATSKDLEAKSVMESLDGYDNETDRNDAKRLLEISKPQELTFSTLLCTVPMDNASGWGGKGRITLIGDAAHALRPASGLGGSLAFEDVVLLTRHLKSKTTHQVPEALREFERIRFSRCKTIVDDQTRIAEAQYGKDRKPSGTEFVWTEEFEEWVFKGPDADPNPPTKMYVEE